MTNEEKMNKIQVIYSDFLKELNELRKGVNEKVKAHIDNIDKEEIKKTLDKINKQI